MPTDRASEQINLHRTLRSTRAPETITQKAFEGDGSHLRRLTRLLPGQEAKADDLWAYVQDLRYTDIQDPISLPVAVLLESLV